MMFSCVRSYLLINYTPFDEILLMPVRQTWRRVMAIMLAVLTGVVLAFGSARADDFIAEIGGFLGINGIAVDDAGEIYAVDFNDQRVEVYSSDGTFQRSIGSFGHDDGQFDEPCGIALNSRDGVLYVSHGVPSGPSFDHRVQAFTAAGAFLFEVGDGFGTGDDKFDAPCQIALDRSGNLYIADSGNRRVQVFGILRDAGGAQIGAVPLFRFDGSSGAGEFNRIQGVGIHGPSDRLYAVENFGARVQIYQINRDGNGIPNGATFISSFGAFGAGEGQFDRPGHVAVAGMVYVADGNNQRVQVFDTDGVFHHQINGAGSTGGVFQNGPFGVATNNLGQIVTEDDTRIVVTSIDRDGDGLLDVWETQGVDVDNDGTIDLDLPNIAGPGIGADPNHKDLFLELDWVAGVEPKQPAIQAMKTAFAFAPINAGGIANPDGLPGINLWIDTGSINATQVSEDGGGPGSCNDGIENAVEGAGSPPGSCSNGIDDDGDGSIDALDFKCDGADFADTQCQAFEGLTGGSCLNGFDDDGNGLIDGADPSCLVGDNLGGGNAIFDPTANELGGARDRTCSDGVDNDGNGLMDGNDPACQYNGGLTLGGLFFIFKNGTESIPTEDGGGVNSCFDGVDNGGAGDGIDGADPECRTTCFDGLDNDGNGLADAADPACQGRGNFDRRVRKLVFRYGIVTPGGGGLGEVNGKNFATANGGDGGTLMHEFGHNLGLRHGGTETINRKPNYISVMDYDEQFCIFPRGSTGFCSRSWRRLLDYSPARFGGNEGTNTSPNVCFDGRDNDGDGLVDAADDECQTGISRAAAPLAAINDSALNENMALDSTNTGLSVVFYDQNANRILWNADGDVDGDGTADGIDLAGDGAPFNAVNLNIDINLDGICVCAGADGVLDTMAAGGDDAIFPAGVAGCGGRASIRNGLNKICETTAAAADVQIQNEGNAGAGSCSNGVDDDGDGQVDGADPSCSESNPMSGADDWTRIVLDFKPISNAGGQSFGENLPTDDHPTQEDFLRQLQALNTADLAIALQAAPDPVEVGNQIDYTLTVTGSGLNPTSDVRVQDLLDSDVTYVTDTGNCDLDAGELTCDIGELPRTVVKSFDVTVQTGACEDGVPSQITNEATVVNLAGPDPDHSNNMASLTITPVDTTGPAIQCNAPSTIRPQDAPVTYIATATDTCDDNVTATIIGFECAFVAPEGRTVNKKESCVVQVQSNQISIVDSGGVGDRISWTVRATDASSNTTETQCSVVVTR